ncbi:ORF2 [Fowl aviadenovirus D]|uniref:ORF2 n=1 Tax=Fowl aviadenovirus D TaxID=190064 RepID=A0A650C0M5_9ADEN|nr:ORF2 [Fowl aviadenovirus D]
MSGSRDRYWSLVESLINRGIVTRQQWYFNDRSEYGYYTKRYRGAMKLSNLFRDVRRHMFWTKCLADYMLTPETDFLQIEENPFYSVFSKNGYDPALVGSMLLAWAARQSKRNTVWIRGAPVTGAPYLAEAIAYCCPLMTCVDWRNKQNPFEKGFESLLFWWDGGHVPHRCVALCRQVFRGENVMFPREDGQMSELVRTPVLMYSEHDACRTLIKWGVFSDEFSDGLRNSMYCLDLSAPMEGAQCVTCADARAFFTWAYPRRMDFDCF